MAYGERGGERSFGDKPKFQGNWECSKCGKAITELPFKPNPDRVGELKCFDCHKESMGDRPRRGFGGDRGGDRPKQKFQGNWECSKCGKAITELPFKPDPARLNTLSCLDCFKASRG
jgi:ribosomal protein L37AE/L43A